MNELSGNLHPSHIPLKEDLFVCSDLEHVIYGNPDGELKWHNESATLACNLIRDEEGNQFATIPGTNYVATYANSKWAVWQGGIVGSLIRGDFANLDMALNFIRQQIKPHIIRKIQESAGYARYRGAE